MRALKKWTGLTLLLLSICFMQVHTAFANPADTVLKGTALNGIIDIDSMLESHLALQSDGTIWTWEGNGLAKRGPKIPGAVSAEVGNIALKSDGTVWTWGTNESGQLGNGTTDKQKPSLNHEPAQVKGLKNVIAIASGGSFHVALAKDHTAWIWGSTCISAMTRSDFTFKQSYCNAFEEHPDEEKAYVPGLIKREGIVAIAASQNNISIVKEDGSVNRWGYWDNVRMGEDTLPWATKDIVAVSEMYNDYMGSLLLLRKDGTVGYYEPTAGKSKGGFIKISAAPFDANYNLALHQDGSIWNHEDNGNLIQIKGLSRIVDLEARAANSGLALDNRGTVWSWGDAKYGSASQGAAPKKTLSEIKPAAVIKSFSVQLNDDYIPLKAAPIIINGTTFVPLRDVFVAMGAKVNYDSGKITISKGKTTILLEENKRQTTINGITKQVAEAPRYDQGKTIVPLRFVTEALGATVKWNAASDTILIKS
ncbi:stalk domain-containing protein [Bacillus sp. FJAT-26390]|uniref:stalk domain-containing protein n=1 Tax=Bacillus sp. FJAT-26390 TaxID=1743142 RepID=UPI000807F66B|nr:stalk domain-containing protein [Bacillus sp. FJAT-26390]OBZ16628.1 hypothetical protein A7975_01550 [Bacillus sp. FJAT-26390]